jgi:glutamate racemase
MPLWIQLLAVALAGCTHSGAPAAAPPRAQNLVESVALGQSRVYAIDRRTYDAGNLEKLPIGVFDSGIGGLTVLNAILRLDDFDNKTHRPGPDGIPDFENERFVYFGDQANMPYGNYPAAGKERFLKELIVEDALFLLGRRYWPSVDAAAPVFDKSPVKAVVIACNTATAYGLEDVRSALATIHVPVALVGVVEAGAEGAVAARDEGGAVAVMATSGTCRSQTYPRTIERMAKARGVTSPHVVQAGSIGLAGAIEGDPAFISSSGSSTYKGPAVRNTDAPIDAAHLDRYAFDPSGLSGDPKDPSSWHLNSVDNYVRYDVATLVESYRKEHPSVPITTVVLGCTHFPFERDRIAQTFERLRTHRDPDGTEPYASLIASHLTFVDPAQLTARQLYVALRSKEQLLPKPSGAKNAFYISKANPSAAGVQLASDGTLDAKYKYARTEGDFERETVKRVPLRAADLSPPVQTLVKSAMPAVWQNL